MGWLPSMFRLVALAAFSFSTLLHAEAAVFTFDEKNASMTKNSPNKKNHGATNTSYSSLPASFGKSWYPLGTSFDAILQFFPIDPYLCKVNDTSKYTDQAASSNLPMAVLASRGKCPFYRKAAIAETIGRQVQYLIVFNEQDEDALDTSAITPVSAPASYTSRLRIMSVSYDTGVALREYWKSTESQRQHETTKLPCCDANNLTAPLISMMITEEEEEGLSNFVKTPADDDDYGKVVSASSSTNNNSMDLDVLNPTLGLFCSILLLSSSFLLCLVAARPNRRPRSRGTPASPNGGGTTYMGRNLLTRDEIRQYLIFHHPHHSESCCATNETLFPPPSPEHESAATAIESERAKEQLDGENEALVLHCAICLEDIQDDDASQGIVQLPCRHTFHDDCILPWLTERQGTCPLCKYDVYQYVQESAALDFSLSPRLASIWANTRQRWNSITLFPHLQSWSDDDDDEEEENFTEMISLEMQMANIPDDSVDGNTISPSGLTHGA